MPGRCSTRRKTAPGGADSRGAVAESSEQAGARLAAQLRRVTELRRQARAHAELGDAHLALKAWQAARLARTYPDLLAHPRYGDAARFFFDELYGGRDYTQRDADVARILPKLIAMLPAAALSVIADAVELDALSEDLDMQMTIRLGGAGAAGLDDASYCDAFRACGTREARAHQLFLMRHIGDALDRLTRMPLLATTLKLMRGPARMAGLGALQEFLERGFHAFKAMRGAETFLATIEGREGRLLANIYAGAQDPFAGLIGQQVS